MQDEYQGEGEEHDEVEEDDGGEDYVPIDVSFTPIGAKSRWMSPSARTDEDGIIPPSSNFYAEVHQPAKSWTMSPDPKMDDDNNWETDSSISDSLTEVLILDDEDDVVPPSFDLSTDFCHPSGDCSALEESPQLPQKPQEKRISDSSMAYGSDSKCLFVLCLPL